MVQRIPEPNPDCVLKPDEPCGKVEQLPVPGVIASALSYRGGRRGNEAKGENSAKGGPS